MEAAALRQRGGPGASADGEEFQPYVLGIPGMHPGLAELTNGKTQKERGGACVWKDKEGDGDGWGKG